MEEMQTAAISRHSAKVTSIRELLEKSKKQIMLALPSHMKPDHLMRVAMTAIQRNEKLLDCDAKSLMASIIQSAQLGLSLDPIMGQAYLVPYGKVATFIPGYRGLVTLGRQSGDLIDIEAHAVYPDDEFKYVYGLNERLDHTPSNKPPHPEKKSYDLGRSLIAVWMKAKLRPAFPGGQETTHWSVMERWEVDRITERSKAKDGGPWVTDFAEMAKKTIIRREMKLLPMSVELRAAIAAEDRGEAGLRSSIEVDLWGNAAIPTEVTDVTGQEKRAGKNGLDSAAEKSRAGRGRTRKVKDKRENEAAGGSEGPPDGPNAPEAVRSSSGQSNGPQAIQPQFEPPPVPEMLVPDLTDMPDDAKATEDEHSAVWKFGKSLGLNQTDIKKAVNGVGPKLVSNIKASQLNAVAEAMIEWRMVSGPSK